MHKICQNVILIYHSVGGKPPVVAKNTLMAVDGVYCRGKPPVVAQKYIGGCQKHKGKHRGGLPLHFHPSTILISSSIKS